jgi:hypothetical protein
MTDLDLRSVLRRIQELATDTPTPEDAEEALELIYRECEAALVNEKP